MPALTEPATKLGRAIRSRRVARGLSQTEAADLVGVRQATFSGWEVGHAIPLPGHMQRLNDVLGVPWSTWVAEQQMTARGNITARYLAAIDAANETQDLQRETAIAA